MLEEITSLNSQVKNLYEEQVMKSKVNRDLVIGIKENGRKYADQMVQDKSNILKIIDSQVLKVENIKKLIDKI